MYNFALLCVYIAGEYSGSDICKGFQKIDKATKRITEGITETTQKNICLLYTSDAADE